MSIATLVRSYMATAAIEPYSIAQLSADGETVSPATAAGQPLAGAIGKIGAKAGSMADLLRLGVGEVRLGGTVAAGDALTVNASARAIKATGSGQQLIGFAESPGVTGDIVDYLAALGGFAGAGATPTPSPTPTVTLSAAQSINEGNSGPTVFTYTVTRSVTTGAIAVPWTFSPGDTSAADFTGAAYPTGGNVNLGSGAASGTFTISVNGDATSESAETFTVAIAPPGGYSAGASTSATGTILNDDATSTTAPTSFANPILAWEDSSRGAQGLGPGGTNPKVLAWKWGGAAMVVMAREPKSLLPVWREDDLVRRNSSGTQSDGLMFSEDGSQYIKMRNRWQVKGLSAIHDMHIGSQTSNAFQPAAAGTTMAQFVASYRTDMTTAYVPFTVSKKRRLLLQSAWERGVTAGGAFTAGTLSRQAVPFVVDDGATFAAANDGWDFANFRTQIVDPSGDADPRPGMTRDADLTHLAPLGSWTIGKSVQAQVSARTNTSGVAKAIDLYKTGGNLYPNPTFTGAAAITGVTNVAGDMPANHTVAREGTTTLSTATFSVVTVNGTPRLRCAVDTSAMADTTQFEGLKITVSGLAAAALNDWRVANWFTKPSAWDGWRNIARGALAVPGNVGVGLSNINPSSTSLSSLADGVPMPLPSEDMCAGLVNDGLFGITPFVQATAAGATTFSYIIWWTKGTAGQTATIDIFLPEINATLDPHLFLFDPAIAGPDAITVAGSTSFPGDGETVVGFQLNAAVPGYWIVQGGADAGLYAVDIYGYATRTLPMNYGSPNDANADRQDDVTFQHVPFNPAIAAVTVTPTITNTFFNQGFIDALNRADEPLQASAAHTVGGAGTQQANIVGNRLNFVGGTGGARYWWNTQQGDTCEQRYTVRQAASHSAASPIAVIFGLNEDNCVGLRFAASGVTSLVKREAGVQTTLASFNNFIAYNHSVGTNIFSGQFLNDFIEVQQGGHEIGRIAFSKVGYESWRRSGIVHYSANNATGIFDDLGNTVAAARGSKPALEALTVPPTGPISADYAGAIVGRNPAGAVVASAAEGGTWTADGNTLRGVGLGSVSSYAWSMTESGVPGSIPASRTSTGVIVRS